MLAKVIISVYVDGRDLETIEKNMFVFADETMNSVPFADVIIKHPIVDEIKVLSRF